MMHDPKYTYYADFAEQLAPPQSRPSKRGSPVSLLSTAPPLSELSISALAKHCTREVNNYRSGEPSNEQYGLELFRRAIVQSNEDAWLCLQQCFSGLVLSWLRRHPRKEEARRFDSEENYVARAFERFWLATAYKRPGEFSTLAAALQYLRASLNGAILDTLRANSRPKETPLPEEGSPEEPGIEDSIDGGELWELLQEMFPCEQEQRLVYLLFHCGLKPREIVRYCPGEFSDVREVYQKRRNIHDRLLRAADYIRWRL
jgi:hypothetical protein